MREEVDTCSVIGCLPEPASLSCRGVKVQIQTRNPYSCNSPIYIKHYTYMESTLDPITINKQLFICYSVEGIEKKMIR